jgi:hypothetical protein
MLRQSLLLSTRIIFVEEYKFLSFSLRTFLCTYVASFNFDPDIFPSTLFSDVNIWLSFHLRNEFLTPIQDSRRNYTFTCILILMLTGRKRDDKNCGQRDSKKSTSLNCPVFTVHATANC